MHMEKAPFPWDWYFIGSGSFAYGINQSGL
jgi:hypothetical protein